jgi:DNA modification methylase
MIEKNEHYTLINGDCVEQVAKMEDNSIGFSIFSPPFAELFVYSDKEADMGNSKNYEEFFEHFNYLTPELNRVMKPGRLVAVHCMDLTIKKGLEGYIGLRDFSGMLVKNFQDNGFIYHDRITIWKDPVVEMQRTKALGLLHKTIKKDSSMSRTGNPDYLLVFRKRGDNEEPIANTDIPVELWQKYASPVWYDINYSDTLQYMSAREHKDEKHVCPLQLPTIERAIHLWSNPGDTVMTPFAGIGSEVYQAVKMNRYGIGVELKESYFNTAIQNINTAIQEKHQLTIL